MNKYVYYKTQKLSLIYMQIIDYQNLESKLILLIQQIDVSFLLLTILPLFI